MSTTTASRTQVSAPSSGMEAELLTFGVEFEFILVGAESEIEHAWEIDQDTGACIVRDILAADGRIPVFEEEDEFGDGARAAAFVMAYDAMGGADTREPPASASNASTYAKWTVETDASVELTEAEEARLPPGFAAFSVEVKTRIFSPGEQAGSLAACLAEIDTFLSVLHARLNSGADDSSIRLLTNAASGLHVHVGRRATPQQPARFPLRTLKNILQLTTAFERQFDALHSTDRINRPGTTHPCYCLPPSWQFKGAPALPTHSHPALRDCAEAPSPAPWCTGIEAAVAKLSELRTVTRNQRFSAVNLVNTTPALDAWGDAYERSRKWTVEFRQGRGSLEMREVRAWVGVVLAVCGFAEAVAVGELKALIEGSVEDPGFGVQELLETVGAPEHARAYYAGVVDEDREAFERMEEEERRKRAREEEEQREFSEAELRAFLDGSADDSTDQLEQLVRHNRKTSLELSYTRIKRILGKLTLDDYGKFPPAVKSQLVESYFGGGRVSEVPKER